MKFQALLVLSTLLFVSSVNNVSFAQAADSDAKAKLPQNSFYFYFINGYALAYKYYYSEKSDLRFRLDLSSSYSDSKHNEDFNSSGNNSLQSNEQNNTTSNNVITAEFAYLNNFYRSPFGQAYAGIGPFISYTRNKQDYSNTYNYPSSASEQSSSNLTYGFSAGLSAFVGIEAFVISNLRVFAETQFTGGRNWSKTEYSSESQSTPSNTKSTNNNTGTTGSWYYNLTSVRIGLGISI